MEPRIMNGVIAEATWKVTHGASPKPYLLLEITVEPFDFYGRTLTKLFKTINPIVPLCPGMLSPLAVLEKATDMELKVTEPIEVGQKVPELKDCPITFEVIEVTLDNTVHPRVNLLKPKNEGD